MSRTGDKKLTRLICSTSIQGVVSPSPAMTSAALFTSTSIAPSSRSARAAKLVDGVELAEVDGPGAAFGLRGAAIGEHGVEEIGAARAYADHGTGRRELARERGADARRRAGYQDSLPGPLFDHCSPFCVETVRVFHGGAGSRAVLG